MRRSWTIWLAWRRGVSFRVAKIPSAGSGTKFQAPVPDTLTAPIVVVEYGIESCHDSTLRHINRGHSFECARKAVEMTAERGIDTGAHFILGLPGETERCSSTNAALYSSLPLRSVKFHQLQIVRGTVMEKEYAADPSAFYRPGLDEYLDFVIDILERLRPDLYIERVAGEVPPRFVNDTPWGLVRNFEILRLRTNVLRNGHVARPFIFKAFFWTNVLRNGTRGRPFIFKALINRYTTSACRKAGCRAGSRFFEAIRQTNPPAKPTIA